MGKLLVLLLVIIGSVWVANAQNSQDYIVVVSCPQPTKANQEQIKCKHDTIFVKNAQSTKLYRNNRKIMVYEQDGKYYRIVTSCPAQSKDGNETEKCFTDTIQITKEQYYLLKGKVLLPMPDGTKLECERLPKNEKGTDRCYVVFPDGTRRDLGEYIQSRVRSE